MRSKTHVLYLYSRPVDALNYGNADTDAADAAAAAAVLPLLLLQQLLM